MVHDAGKPDGDGHRLPTGASDLLVIDDPADATADTQERRDSTLAWYEAHLAQRLGTAYAELPASTDTRTLSLFGGDEK